MNFTTAGCMANALAMLAILSPTILRADDVDVSAAEERVIAAAVAKVADSVVRIETIGGLEKVGELLVGEGPTTGLVVHKDGYILSSAINFVQMPNSILVTLPSGKKTAAKIIARDKARMLVLLKVTSDEELKPVETLSRDKLIVGQWSIAVGRAYDATTPNMSVGIVSASNRIWDKAIQTDAKISPANYGGPLIDIHGKVMGILAPMSPRGANAIAGAEWYESGIGFAVPIDEVMKRFDTLKAGEDLHPGLLGITMARGNVYVLPAAIQTAPAGSPAAKAGLQAGDKIVAVNGKAIVRQAQLKHALGGQYAGDTIEITVERDGKEIKKSIELAKEIKPFEHPFAGILPMRDGDGVTVRHVVDGGPASKAGVKPGDKIISLAGAEAVDAGGLQDAISLHEPGDSIELEIESGGDKKKVNLTLAGIPSTVPSELPPAHKPIEKPNAGGGAVGLVDVKLAEEKNECFAYVPESYDQSIAHGLVVWLYSPDQFDKDTLKEKWEEACAKQDLILLAPRPADAKGFKAEDAAFIQKTVVEIGKTHNIDRSRIVAVGSAAEGTMAFHTAFSHPDLFRGTAAFDSALPARSKITALEPGIRYSVFTVTFGASKLAGRVQASMKRLQTAKIPVVEVKAQGDARLVNDEEFAQLLRWVDSLDKF